MLAGGAQIGLKPYTPISIVESASSFSMPSLVAVLRRINNAISKNLESLLMKSVFLNCSENLMK